MLKIRTKQSYKLIHQNIHRSITVINSISSKRELAPVLFNLYVNNMIWPSKISTSCIYIGWAWNPCFVSCKIVLLPTSEAGLCKILNVFDNSIQEGLSVNHDKSKITIFNLIYFYFIFLKKAFQTEAGWGGIEQVAHCKYLGVIFSYNLTWKAHVHSATEIARTYKCSFNIFFYLKGGQYVSAAIEAFNAKIISQVLSGAGI